MKILKVWFKRPTGPGWVIVSPSLLMLSIQVIQSVLKDTRIARTGAPYSGGSYPPDGGCRAAG